MIADAAPRHGSASGVVVPVRLVVGPRAITHLVTGDAPATSLCGLGFAPGEIDIVPVGSGAPCTSCLTRRVLAVAAPTPAITVGGYEAVGWPVERRADGPYLAVGGALIALLVPRALAERARAVLVARRRPTPVLTHPAATGHHVMLAGDPFGAPLPWPDDVVAVSGWLPLPDPDRLDGPTWVHAPVPGIYDLCGEVDLCGALRADGGTLISA